MSRTGVVVKVERMRFFPTTLVTVRFDDGRLVRYGTSSSYLKRVGARVLWSGSALVEAA